MASQHKSHYRPVKYEKSRKGGDKAKLGKRIPWFTISPTGEKKHGDANSARNIYIASLLSNGFKRITSRSFSNGNNPVVILSRK